jgi:hypothetical protein
MVSHYANKQLGRDELAAALAHVANVPTSLLLRSKRPELSSPLSLSPNGPILPNNSVCRRMF